MAWINIIVHYGIHYSFHGTTRREGEKNSERFSLYHFIGVERGVGIAPLWNEQRVLSHTPRILAETHEDSEDSAEDHSRHTEALWLHTSPSRSSCHLPNSLALWLHWCHLAQASSTTSCPQNTPLKEVSTVWRDCTKLSSCPRVMVLRPTEQPLWHLEEEHEQIWGPQFGSKL